MVEQRGRDVPNKASHRLIANPRQDQETSLGETELTRAVLDGGWRDKRRVGGESCLR